MCLEGGLVFGIGTPVVITTGGLTPRIVALLRTLLLTTAAAGVGVTPAETALLVAATGATKVAALVSTKAAALLAATESGVASESATAAGVTEALVAAVGVASLAATA